MSKKVEKPKGSDSASSIEAKTSTEEGGDVYLASTSTHVDHDVWLINSGASYHMTPHRESLLHLGQIPTACSTQLPLSIVERPTNLGPPQTSFHMTSFFRRPNFRLSCDVSNVARETLQTWQDRRFKRRKRDVSNVARETLQTWQERRFKRGKSDVSNVARETLQTSQERRCKRRKTDVSNVARPTFQTWQERRCKRGKTDVSIVARETFQTSQERRCKRRKRDVNRYHLRRGCYGSDTPKCRNSDLLVGI
jgi:hypothetical protein